MILEYLALISLASARSAEGRLDEGRPRPAPNRRRSLLARSRTALATLLREPAVGPAAPLVPLLRDYPYGGR